MSMEILITDIVDAALIIGVTAVFLFADIIAKNHLKISLKDIGADLALGAFLVQLAFLTDLLTAQEMSYFNSNVVLAVCFAIFWVICLWLPSKKDILADMFSYTLGIFALAASIMHSLGTPNITGIAIVVAASLILSVIGFLFADHLRNETVTQRFLDISKEMNIYEMNENYRKIDACRGGIDPFQPIIDIIRGAIRNDDNLTATRGIRSLAVFGSELVKAHENTSLVISHLNIHLYGLGMLAEDEKNRDLIIEVIDAFETIACNCVEKNMEQTTLQTVNLLHNFFRLHTERSFFPALGRIELIKRSETTADLYNVLMKNTISSPRHKFARASGKIGEAAASYKMIEAAEKSVELLKIIAIDAASKKDIDTLEYVRTALVEVASMVKENRLEHLEKQIITTLRDICIKAVQESSDRKKNDSLPKAVAALRDIGEIFGERSYLDVTGSLKDIGIVAARRHSDAKVSHVIPHIEHFCVLASEMEMDEQASRSVIAIMEVCEASIREQMVESTARSSKTLASLSNRGNLTIFVNEAVFELGKYREMDREMFALFEKTYNNSGGK
ncbi:hypothetical protein [Methanolobus halotolerans]|uniref:Uncharacterized protein n=1 Tax=Methanolobus halotolerans TaxID=2052935 RepID=A0A4E0Q9T0_9EURY|nr:hypothetical protein [Methanolobus halotolerans]TGC09012.1 hypothetical protein CUN85_08265 [Methanolobus halotolerans]